MMFIGAIVLLLIVLFVFNKGKSGSEIYTKFGVSESSHTILSTDLGKAQARMKLSRYGINGIADAVFKARSGRVILVGEFKSRKHRGVVRLSEFYQIIMYLGHILAENPGYSVKGVLAYADARVSINFDPDVYAALIGLRGEFKETLYRRKVVNPKPLHKRMNVRGCNRSITFTAKN